MGRRPRARQRPRAHALHRCGASFIATRHAHAWLPAQAPHITMHQAAASRCSRMHVERAAAGGEGDLRKPGGKQALGRMRAHLVGRRRRHQKCREPAARTADRHVLAVKRYPFFFFSYFTKFSPVRTSARVGRFQVQQGIMMEKFMVKRGTLASARGPRPSTETGIARAETLGPDGGQRIWKPGPDAAAGPSGAQESAPILFPSASMHWGNSGGARGGGPRGMGDEGGRPGAGTRHVTQPPAGAPAGGRASTVVPGARLSHSIITPHKTKNVDRGVAPERE